ncbi:Mannosyl-oligosaccharide 1,2-alpha-mannosidase IC [Elsinoe australis]|uniref:alpha-1,2-Mannosidase n=1 Tax=Elsinoe australis TaxID=40998 RepID=A0A2P7Z7L0_9PEZI|nr:Mannosyl-oligosaccharide 1,2-alpha-mannosidase IC [Elsinoe australis]
MLRDWNAYHERAWGKAELAPVAGVPKDTYGGWAATIVDSLDTLLIMDLKAEYEEAVEFALKIDFKAMPEGVVSSFEATIRYLGGFLSAYDLSGDHRLLLKAIEVADLIYKAFDTPNRMPVHAIDFAVIRSNQPQLASEESSIAGLGSLALEFLRLTQLTGDRRWYDAPRRVMEVFSAAQNKTRLPGMWPAKPINARTGNLWNGTGLFHMGGDSDSHYEYLLKTHILIGGSSFYEGMYRQATDTIVQNILYRPMLPNNPDVLLPGQISFDQNDTLQHMYRVDHLACFTGGMLALGGKVTNNDSHIELGRKVTEGCVEMYSHSPLGIMPDEAFVLPCDKCALSSDANCCTFDRDLWLAECLGRTKGGERLGCESRQISGIISVQNAEFKLRPEALESIFYMYRITGDKTMPDMAWEMFERIKEHTWTEYASAAIMNVMDLEAPKKDEMESYWFAETLKYLYLIFSEEDLISLDEWVFNTEAHPFRRPKS